MPIDDDSSLADDGSIGKIALAMLMVFFALVVLQVLPYLSFLFLSLHGWSHRLAGCIHLGILLFGAVSCWMAMNNDGSTNNHNNYLASWSTSKNLVLYYDIVLGFSGVTTTLTAARDFPHKHVQNIPGQSGTLHRKAIVTQSEMIEHSFYQGLNLLQSIYLHVLARIGKSTNKQPLYSLIALWAVTAPWLLRHRFPVHSFSQNWKSKKVQETSTAKSSSGEILLYRIKKAQYVFYKHVILHGLNISAALSASHNSQTVIPYGLEWRIFWLLLNTSYVMEFFLQTLVKRSVLSQSHMIGLQRLLMASASLAAIRVLFGVRIGVCVVSLGMNFVNRHHDVANTLLIASGFFLLDAVFG